MTSSLQSGESQLAATDLVVNHQGNPYETKIKNQ
jgi:hypothetical protein